MKELIRFDEETQKTFLKEVSGRGRRKGHVSEESMTCLTSIPLNFTGKGDALFGPSQRSQVHWAVL